MTMSIQALAIGGQHGQEAVTDSRTVRFPNRMATFRSAINVSMGSSMVSAVAEIGFRIVPTPMVRFPARFSVIVAMMLPSAIKPMAQAPLMSAITRGTLMAVFDNHPVIGAGRLP